MPQILIVDDDEAYRNVIKEHLSGTYEIIETGLPESALALTLQHKPEAILLDLSMPGMSGYELCQVLSSLAITDPIPIFIVSGEDERNKAFCENLGANKYFTKPIDFARLKAELAWVLKSQKVDRRADPRIQLRVNLKLKGTSEEGVPFEVRATTENMSKKGFLCTGTTPLEGSVTVEAWLCGETEYNLGRARLVRVEKKDDLHPRYGFQFVGDSGIL
jgi:CheY-like chemotaxis protein